MFWLRFFSIGQQKRGSLELFEANNTFNRRSDVKRSDVKRSFEELTNESAPLESQIYTPYNSDFENNGNTYMIKHQPTRRSALDLRRITTSIDDVDTKALNRMSVDTYSSFYQSIGKHLRAYANFNTIHRGNNARILKAYHIVEKKYKIVKVFDKKTMSMSQISNIKKEIEILKGSNDNGGIVQIEDCFEDENFTGFIMKDCENGTLLEFLYKNGGYLTESQCVSKVALPFLNILSYLKKRNIIHRHLKPEHILFDSHQNIKLCDFFSAVILNHHSLTSREGSLNYMAPEMLCKPTPEEIFHEVICNGIDETDLPTFNNKVDIWSYGIILYECLAGKIPFSGITIEEMLACQHNESESWQKMLIGLHGLSNEAQDFLLKIFNIDHESRPDINELMEHPWILSHST